MKWHKPGRILSYPECGIIKTAEEFIMENQLKRADLWKRFVNVYRTGIDSDNNGWRGEYFGKMMRGACFTYAYTKDEELYRILTGAIEDMLSAQRPDGTFSSYRAGEDFRGWDMWCRKYIALAFYYFINVCNDSELIDRVKTASMKHLDAIMERVGPEEEGKIPVTRTSAAWRGLNSSSILEPVVLWYNLTGEPKLLKFAEHIVSFGGIDGDNIFELASQNEIDPYMYPVTKAYEMISCMEGLLEYSITTGNEKYKKAVYDFGVRVLESDFTVIGSGGMTHELFDHSFYRQSSAGICDIAQETCVTVTMMKFFSRLYMEFGDGRFADAVEQSFYNAYLGALNTEKQVEPGIEKVFDNIKPEFLPFDSYSPLTPGRRGRKIGGFMIFPEGNYYGCCACIGSLGAAVFGLSSIRVASGNIFIDHIIPGTAMVNIGGNEITLGIDSAYPYDGRVNIAIKEIKNGSDMQCCSFGLNVRIPGFSGIKYSGSDDGTYEPAVEDGYVSVKRIFKAGDNISIRFDIRPEVLRPVVYGSETVNGEIRKQDEHAKERICVRYGCVVLTPEFDDVPGEGEKPLSAEAFSEEALSASLSECEINAFSAGEKITRTGAVITLTLRDRSGAEIILYDYASRGKNWSGKQIGPWFRIK